MSAQVNYKICQEYFILKFDRQTDRQTDSDQNVRSLGVALMFPLFDQNVKD